MRRNTLSNTLSSQIAVEKYEEMFPAFSDSRECKLLKVPYTNVPKSS